MSSIGGCSSAWRRISRSLWARVQSGQRSALQPSPRAEPLIWYRYRISAAWSPRGIHQRPTVYVIRIYIYDTPLEGGNQEAAPGLERQLTREYGRHNAAPHARLVARRVPLERDRVAAVADPVEPVRDLPERDARPRAGGDASATAETCKPVPRVCRSGRLAFHYTRSIAIVMTSFVDDDAASDAGPLLPRLLPRLRHRDSDPRASHAQELVE